MIVSKKRIYQIEDFAVLVDHGVKSKESEKRYTYLDLARELKKRTMEYGGDVIGALGKITPKLVKPLEELEIREQVKAIQIKALLRSVRILRRILVT